MDGRAEVGSLVVFHTNSNRLVIGRMDERMNGLGVVLGQYLSTLVGWSWVSEGVPTVDFTAATNGVHCPSIAKQSSPRMLTLV